jgi:hypothetical protein
MTLSHIPPEFSSADKHFSSNSSNTADRKFHRQGSDRPERSDFQKWLYWLAVPAFGLLSWEFMDRALRLLNN